jgi:hypothetical protein
LVSFCQAPEQNIFPPGLLQVFSLLAVNQEKHYSEVVNKQEIYENVFLRPQEQGVSEKNTACPEKQHKQDHY